MEKSLEPIVKDLQEKFGASLEEFRGETHCFVKPEQIVETLTVLRDVHQFELLSVLTAVDYYPQTSPRFHIIYQLNSLAKNITLQIRVPLHGDTPKLATISGVYKTGLWRERELLDMFGIEFEGHPDPRRLLMPEGTEGHPLRRDYPLGYEEPQFSFNYEEIGLRKPFAKE